MEIHVTKRMAICEYGGSTYEMLDINRLTIIVKVVLRYVEEFLFLKRMDSAATKKYTLITCAQIF